MYFIYRGIFIWNGRMVIFALEEFFLCTLGFLSFYLYNTNLIYNSLCQNATISGVVKISFGFLLFLFGFLFHFLLFLLLFQLLNSDLCRQCGKSLNYSEKLPYFTFYKTPFLKVNSKTFYFPEWLVDSLFCWAWSLLNRSQARIHLMQYKMLRKTDKETRGQTMHC